MQAGRWRKLLGGGNDVVSGEVELPGYGIV